MVVALAQGQGHHLRVPNQYMGGGPSVKDSEGVWFSSEEKKRSTLEFLSRLLLGKCFVGMAFLPKEVNIGCGHLMHAIGISIESPQPLSI